MTREISASIVNCELTHVVRSHIDLALARRQHADYERCLATLGCSIVRLDAGEDMPDSVFVEDTAVVFDEVAVIGRPGAASRRGETSAVESALATYRPLVHVDEPGTIDGGDVLVAGRRVFVGLSRRTNRSAFEQLTRFVRPFGYQVRAVPVRECLHLKSAVTCVGNDLILVNANWVDLAAFDGFDAVVVDPMEPWGANALRVGDAVVYPRAFPLTRQRLEDRGVVVHTIDADELAKAEGAVTCCSLIFRS